jgi:general secretion pathway protein L
MAVAPAGIQNLASNFFTWWLGELEALWRPARDMVRRASPEMTITISGDEWVVRQHKGGKVKELGRILVSSDPSIGKDPLLRIIKSAKLRHPEPKILLPQDATLRKVLEMPAVAEPDLRHALSFEIDRQTPFHADDVYYDYRILARRPETKRVVVELITAPRASVDQILSRLRDWGVHPSGFDVTIGEGRPGIGVNLLKGPNQQSTWRRSPLALAAAALLVLLVGALFYIPVRQLAALDETLAAQVAEESVAAKRTMAMRGELDQTVKAAQFLDERKKNVPNSLVVLNELTKALPDNTYLFTFSQNAKEVKIAGYSSSASELISAINAVPIFKKPAFTSSIVQDPNLKLERFEILFEVEPGKEARTQ